jgi:hypothetical protein
MIEPLIYTTRGNVPIDSLDYSHEWLENENELRLVETYKAKDNGEIVKQNVHIKIKQGLDIFGKQGKM